VNIPHIARERRNAAPAVKLPVVIFAPYPPCTSGIADYVGELMPHHLADFDVTLVIADDAAAPADTRQSPRVLLASEFRQYRAFFEEAAKLYHIGNNPDHCYMLDLVARDPGIVVLHDFNLNYMHEVATLGWKEPRGCFSALELEYGALGADNVRSRFERKDKGLFATYELPLNGDVLEAATGIITHSRYVQYKVAARVPHTPVWYVPHHLSPALNRFAGMTRAEARRDLRLPENEIIVTAPGFITYAKRIPMLLAALAALRPRIPPFRLVLAGDRRADQYDVDTDIATAGLTGIATCTGYLDDTEFFKHLVACDVVANLRHPSGGEMSGTLIRALGMGAPVIVFDDGPMGELPDSVVRKVAWDTGTQAALTAALYELISDKSRRVQLGARAAAYAHETHAIEKSARRYARIIGSVGNWKPTPQREAMRQHFPHPKIVARRLQQRETAGAPSVDGRLWWQCAKAPLGQAGRRALVVAPRPHATAEFLARTFEWQASDVTAMNLDEFLAPTVRDRNGNALPLGAFAFALLIVPAVLPEIRAAGLMRRVNAALCRGGSISLEVWIELDAASDEAPLAENRIGERLTDAGFAAVSPASLRDAFFVDPVVSFEGSGRGLRFACVSGRKASTFVLWRFAYDMEGSPLHYGGRIG
jgi:glycosyltransferase involved in cell wall biosynthesis